MLARKELRRAHPGCRLLHWVESCSYWLEPVNDAKTKQNRSQEGVFDMYDIPALTILLDWIEFDDWTELSSGGCC